MIGVPREELASLLHDLRSEGSFSTRRTAPVDDLVIEVKRRRRRGVSDLTGVPVDHHVQRAG